MAEILIVKPGVLSAADKAALRKAGVIPVTAENPDEVRFLRAHAEIGGGSLALAAMKALASSGNTRNEHHLFVKLIAEALEQKHSEEVYQ